MAFAIMGGLADGGTVRIVDAGRTDRLPARAPSMRTRYLHHRRMTKERFWSKERDARGHYDEYMGEPHQNGAR